MNFCDEWTQLSDGFASCHFQWSTVGKCGQGTFEPPIHYHSANLLSSWCRNLAWNRIFVLLHLQKVRNCARCKRLTIFSKVCGRRKTVSVSVCFSHLMQPHERGFACSDESIRVLYKKNSVSAMHVLLVTVGTTPLIIGKLYFKFKVSKHYFEMINPTFAIACLFSCRWSSVVLFCLWKEPLS